MQLPIAGIRTYNKYSIYLIPIYRTAPPLPAQSCCFRFGRRESRGSFFFRGFFFACEIFPAFPGKSIERFFKADEADAANAVELAGDDPRLPIAEFMIQCAGGAVFLVGVHAKKRAAGRVPHFLIKIHKFRVAAAALRRGIDDERVQKNVPKPLDGRYCICYSHSINCINI